MQAFHPTHWVKALPYKYLSTRNYRQHIVIIVNPNTTSTPHPQFKRNFATHTSSLWKAFEGDGWRRRRGRLEFVRRPASGESDLNHRRLLLIFCFKHYAFQQFLCLSAILREDCHEMNLKGIFKIKAQKTFLWGRELSLSEGDEWGLIAFEWIIKGKQRANCIHGRKPNTKLCIALKIHALKAAVHLTIIFISHKNISQSVVGSYFVLFKL